MAWAFNELDEYPRSSNTIDISRIIAEENTTECSESAPGGCQISDSVPTLEYDRSLSSHHVGFESDWRLNPVEGGLSVHDGSAWHISRCFGYLSVVDLWSGMCKCRRGERETEREKNEEKMESVRRCNAGEGTRDELESLCGARSGAEGQASKYHSPLWLR